MFLYEFTEKTAQKADTVTTYIRRNKKLFENHIEKRQNKMWLDDKAVKILLKKYPEVRKKYPWGDDKELFEDAIVKAIKILNENQLKLEKQISRLEEQMDAMMETLEDSFDHEEQQKPNGIISLEEIFRKPEEVEIDKLTKQVNEQREIIDELKREISVLQNSKKSIFGFKKR